MSAITQIAAAMSKRFRFLQINRAVRRRDFPRRAQRTHFTHEKDSQKIKVMPVNRGFLLFLILQKEIEAVMAGLVPAIHVFRFENFK
jgi:hypothetical protein